MTRILVTGASGFIGRHLLSLLINQGHDVHAVARLPSPGVADVHWHRADLLEPAAARWLTERVAADRLVHLAWYAEPGLYRDSPQNIAWTEASLRLLRAFSAGGGSRAVFVGSVFEYDWTGGVCTEEITPIRPVTLYGACKSALASIVKLAAFPLGMSCAWARVFWLYGPHEPPGRLISSVIEKLLAGQPVVVTSGALRRDFLHVRDVAAAVAALLETDVEGPVNIGSGVPLAISQVVQQIGSLIGREELIGRGTQEASDEPLMVVADVNRLTREVGFRPAIGLDAGLRETIEWWRTTTMGAGVPGSTPQ